MRGNAEVENFGSDLLEYQTTLATAIFDLDGLYQTLESERKQLVLKKRDLAEDRFLARVKRLGRYQQAIRSAIELGKALGDAFAWFFYRDEHETLTKHRQHERITELPPETGAAGELGFIKQRVVNGNLVLYHAITNILRHGDVSFIDLKDFRLVGLGELKTRRGAPGEFHVTGHCVTRKPASEVFGVVPATATPSDREPLSPPDRDERFRRQLKRMAACLSNKLKDEDLHIVADSYLPELDRLGLALKESQDAYERCGPSLLLAGYRFDDSKSLFGRLVRRSSDVTERVKGVADYAPLLMENSQRGTSEDCNAFVIGFIRTDFCVGRIPLFWWPIRTELAEWIYFQDVVIMTIYNPAHIVRKLRELGFEVRRLGKSQRHRVTKQVGGARLVLEQLEPYTSLVQDQLWKEGLVIKLLLHANELVESGTVDVNTAINLNLRQRFGRAPSGCARTRDACPPADG